MLLIKFTYCYIIYSIIFHRKIDKEIEFLFDAFFDIIAVEERLRQAGDTEEYPLKREGRRKNDGSYKRNFLCGSE